jgi:glycosyltransferase involved in cell wall biosynthesis
MKRVLVLGKYYPPFSGGIEAYTKDVSEALALENDVTVYCFNHKGGTVRETIGGVKVVRFRTLMTLRRQPISIGMMFYILRFKCDILHMNAPNFIAAFALFIRMLFRPGDRLVVTHHTDVYGRWVLRRIGLIFYKFICRRAEYVIVTSAKNVQYSRDLPRDLNAIVIPLGIDATEAGSAHLPPTKFRQENAFVVGFLGRLVRYKGVGVFIRAISEIPDARAIIAGEGPYRKQAEELAAALDLTDRVIFLGDVRGEAKEDFYRAIDVFAFPSTEVTETFGITQMEAMIRGIPVVASDLPTGVTDVAIDGETALLAKPNDVASLASGIARVRDDNALRDRIVAGAREHLHRNFSKSIVLAKTRALFSEALAR